MRDKLATRAERHPISFERGVEGLSNVGSPHHDYWVHLRSVDEEALLQIPRLIPRGDCELVEVVSPDRPLGAELRIDSEEPSWAEHGMVDVIVSRLAMRAEIARLLNHLRPRD